MICYKDKTFCSFSECSKFSTCDRAMTEFRKKLSELSGLPVSYFAEKPECYEETNQK